MNKLEKRIYDLVKRHPVVKEYLRNIYQGIFAYVPINSVESKYEIVEREGYFFGFHDKIPWSQDNTMLLAHKFNISNNEVKKEDAVEIGYFLGDEFMNFQSLGRTKSWNWQQGSMLQWLGKDDKIIFNYWNGTRNIARIISKSGQLVGDLDAPVGAVSVNGSYALSYSFERLNIGMQGYGYIYENDKDKEQPTPLTSGLSIIDIENGKSKMLFSLSDLASLEPQETMNDAYHFVTHCLFAPNGKRYLFLHRWYKGGKRLFSRMISSNLKGEKVHIFPTGDMVSHISWVNSRQVLAYCNTKEHGDGYFLFNDMSPRFERIGGSQFTSDGHPQFCAENDLIVTDTYPNRYRVQELILYNQSKDEKEVIAKLQSPRYYKDSVRCDLHPRWDRSGTMICFDSAHTGTRALCTITLNNK